MTEKDRLLQYSMYLQDKGVEFSLSLQTAHIDGVWMAYAIATKTKNADGSDCNVQFAAVESATPYDYSADRASVIASLLALQGACPQDKGLFEEWLETRA